MPALTPEGPVGGNAIGAVLFLQAANMTYQAFGTLNSSPWTTENVGADAEKMASMYEYVTHATVSAFAMAGVGAYVARSWWPVVGVLVVDAYLVWIYHRAAQRGSAAGSVGKGWFGTWGRENG
jgi:hypothetical protein